jgi:hypothetical protein
MKLQKTIAECMGKNKSITYIKLGITMFIYFYIDYDQICDEWAKAKAVNLIINQSIACI